MPIFKGLQIRMLRSDGAAVHGARPFLTSAVLVMLFSLSCSGSSSKEKPEEDPKITTAPPRAASVSLLDSQFPNGSGGYVSLGAKDFVNGAYNQDLPVASAPVGFSATTDEAVGMKNGLFYGGPGFVWKLDPPYPVTITLTSRGRSQAINKTPNDGSGKVAVSLYSFSDVYPPAYRERYELSIASIKGSLAPFTYTYTFTVKKLNTELIFAVLSQGDGPAGIKMGRDNPSFNLAKVVTSSKCEDCTIEVTGVTASAAIKKFTELPAIPQPGPLRITFPRRFSGLLVSNARRELPAQILGNNTPSVRIMVPLPGDMTTVQPWCSRSGGSSSLCLAKNRGQQIPTYFKFLNAVPYSDQDKSFGGTSGIANATISGTATVTVRRDGNEVEKRQVSFDSGTATAMDSLTIPPWTLDELRSALFTGAPEFSP